MTEDYLNLIIDVILEHPGPWKSYRFTGDNGGIFWSISDANGNELLDGERGVLSDKLVELITNFPNIAAEILNDNSTPMPPFNDSRRPR